MKTSISSIALLLVLFISFTLSAALPPDDGTVIIIKPASESETTAPNRSSEAIPISAYFDGFTSTVFVAFSSNLGEVEMVIVNLLTGETQYEEIDAYLAPAVIPISGTEGMYSIVFTLLDGTEYMGEFEICGE